MPEQRTDPYYTEARETAARIISATTRCTTSAAYLVYDAIEKAIELKLHPHKAGLEGEVELKNKVTFFCSNCGRTFSYKTTEEGYFAGWVRCECGQDRPVIEEDFGYTAKRKGKS